MEKTKEEINSDEIIKAKKLLEESEISKKKEFAEKINVLCEEYGYILNVQSQIIINKK